MHSQDEYEHPPGSNVVYITSNIPGAGVDATDFDCEFALGCSCVNLCNESATCSCTRGLINYSNGLKQHVTGPLIECNSLCTCRPDCGNRLVQNGPIDCLFVAQSGSKGFGLFTNQPIARGRFICEYAGEITDEEEAKRRFEQNHANGCMNYILVFREFIGDHKCITTCVDPAGFGNIGRYSNHSCSPNAEVVAVRINHSTPRLCLFASKDIRANEEVTFDYAEGHHESAQPSLTPCQCCSDNCRGFLPHQPIG